MSTDQRLPRPGELLLIPDGELFCIDGEVAQSDAHRLLHALHTVRHCLQIVNDMPDGPIRDTIWRRPGETLFDFIDATITQATQPEQAKGGEAVTWSGYSEQRAAWFLAYSKNPNAKTRPLIYGDTAAAAPEKPMTDDTALLDFMAERRVSVTPEYEGQWCARQYDDEAAAVAQADGATPRDVLRELHNAYFVITDKGGA